MTFGNPIVFARFNSAFHTEGKKYVINFFSLVSKRKKEKKTKKKKTKMNWFQLKSAKNN